MLDEQDTSDPSVDPQVSHTLDPRVICTAFEDDGNEVYVCHYDSSVSLSYPCDVALNLDKHPQAHPAITGSISA